MLDHFAHCLNTIKHRVWVDEYFGWEVESHDEAAGVVRVTCSAADGRRLVIETKRLIKTPGFEVKPNDPLEISSGRVQSVSPNFCDMRNGDIGASDGLSHRWSEDGHGHRACADHRVPRP